MKREYSALIFCVLMTQVQNGRGSMFESYYRVCRNWTVGYYNTTKTGTSLTKCGLLCLEHNRNNNSSCNSASYAAYSNTCFLSQGLESGIMNIQDNDVTTLLRVSDSTCRDYLVSGPNPVSDSQLTASSIKNNGNNFGPGQARLHNIKVTYPNGTYDAGIWSPASQNSNQYIQVDFETPKIITGIATQGSPAYNHYITKYRMLYSIDCITFNVYTDDTTAEEVVFPGNFDRNTVVNNTLYCPLLARCVRLNPTEWINFYALRFDVIGCQHNVLVV